MVQTFWSDEWKLTPDLELVTKKFFSLGITYLSTFQYYQLQNFKRALSRKLATLCIENI